jgi:hypothetical protein
MIPEGWKVELGKNIASKITKGKEHHQNGKVLTIKIQVLSL